MNLQKLYWNRPVVYSGLIVIGSMMLIDALPRYTLLHENLKKTIDPVLDVTGLWQGSWKLFSPSPDHVNVRVGAHFNWEDGSQTTWYQPNWHEMSPWEKIRNFRKMGYYDALWRSSYGMAWDPFCEHLARAESAEKLHELEYITLFHDADLIPPPDEEWRPAYSAPRYGESSHLYTWFADE